MESLYNVINTTPIIDNHAHNLLLSSELATRDFIVITTEAANGALRATTSSLSHIRAVKQLSHVLGCEAHWGVVQAAIVKRRQEAGDSWAKRCFEGIETVLIDDGLDASTVHNWEWHDRLTRSPCKRIVRIEKIAEIILTEILEYGMPTSIEEANDTTARWLSEFQQAIERYCEDSRVVGFKSVICYRTGLSVPVEADVEPFAFLPPVSEIQEFFSKQSSRLEHPTFSPMLLNIAAKLIEKHKKPLQFHTGLGDNDIMLTSSSPSLLQTFIKEHPRLAIVLLHASYPFTREAGYLASVYENVYLDIGEVFPMVSQDGQENIVRASLELCPSEKLCWSTDGHWFPETYLLAVIQVREALTAVLSKSVENQSMTISQAIKVVEDVFFNTSNQLYGLKLPLKPLVSTLPLTPAVVSTLPSGPLVSAPSQYRVSDIADGLVGLSILYEFLVKHPSIKYLRTQWLDYTATPRLRILPIKRALSLFSVNKSIGITKAVLGMLQPDIVISSFSPAGEYNLVPCFESLRLGERDGYATVQCEFRELDGQRVNICPRTVLRREVHRASENGIHFLMGFELEVTFLHPVIDVNTKKITYDPLPNSSGHSWSAAAAVRFPETMSMIEEIVASMSKSEIDLQQWHPESAPGQYEFVTGPLPPLAAVDTLIATREIIYAVASKYGLKATFVPKPYPHACGTGAHVHISLIPEEKADSFYAGVLENLRFISAFTYSGRESYDRVADSVWSGGRYVCWGTQNRETPLRKIDGSHWEMKCMDGLANPYLAIAAVFSAGLRGVELDSPLTLKDCKCDPARLDDRGRQELGIVKMLPFNIKEALQTLTDKPTLLGDDVATVYGNIKAAELAMLDAMEAEDRRIFMIGHY